jgi:hypothetical protein
MKRVSRRRSGGGAVIVIAKAHAALRLSASLMEQLTCVVPTGNTSPGGGVQVTLTSPSPP